MRNLFIAFSIVFVLTIVNSITNYPPPKPVQAEKSTQTTHKAVKQPSNKKVAKHVTVKKKPIRKPVEAPRAVQPSVANIGGSCSDWIRSAGITDVVSANDLIARESGCNPNAINPSSGACGVAQELPCGKSGCSLGDGACQVKWMNMYVIGRYGSWLAAIQFHNLNHWY